MNDHALQRSLWNWMMGGTITSQAFKQLIDDGKVTSGKERTQMIPYAQLRLWGVVPDEEEF